MATDTPVTTSHILDLLAYAVDCYKRDGQRGIDWVWGQSMTTKDKLAFDLFLVRTGDPLAFEAGTTEWRFRARVKAMANQTDARKERK